MHFYTLNAQHRHRNDYKKLNFKMLYTQQINVFRFIEFTKTKFEQHQVISRGFRDASPKATSPPGVRHPLHGGLVTTNIYSNI